MTPRQIIVLIAAFAVVVAAAVGVTLAVADSDDPVGASAGPSTTRRSSEQVKPIHEDTILACRSLAENRDLAEFWREVNNSPTVPSLLVGRAQGAVIMLGKYAADPNVDPKVADAIASATLAAVDMTPAAGTFDIEQFRATVTSVVTACEDVGVDMTVPE